MFVELFLDCRALFYKHLAKNWSGMHYNQIQVSPDNSVFGSHPKKKHGLLSRLMSHQIIVVSRLKPKYAKVLGLGHVQFEAGNKSVVVEFTHLCFSLSKGFFFAITLFRVPKFQ